ncbi:MAG: hypothetical protein GXX79_11405 [Actinomycetales bacterium]|nr:hypothetical protein [Actinomycetales bacterium]
MLFTVTVMHNITRADGRLAVLARFTANRLLPGDTLQVLGILTVPATSLADAAETTYAIGNGAGEPGLVQVYRSWGVRSLCVGDAVIIQAPEGRRHVLACTTTDWLPLADPRAYTILPGHRSTTQTTDDTDPQASTGSPAAVHADTLTDPGPGEGTAAASTRRDRTPGPGNDPTTTDEVDIPGNGEGGERS